MSTTKALREEEKTTALPRLSLVDTSDMDWLTEELAGDLQAGLAEVTTLDSGEEFTTWNNWIVQIAGLVPEIKPHLTIRKTKKGVKYYGCDRKLYGKIKDASGGTDGLPAL